MNIWDVCSALLGWVCVIFIFFMAVIILFGVLVGLARSYRKHFPTRKISRDLFLSAARNSAGGLHHSTLEAGFIQGATWAYDNHLSQR